MHNAGLVVAYNSDDAEMSRRLNQEAKSSKVWRYFWRRSLEICDFESS
jgi:hypothetical protein